MIKAYQDVRGRDITREVWWSTVDAAIRAAWWEYVKNKIIP
jgi:hypothetical protein